MFAREKISTCSFIESSEKPPYVRSIDDNKWIISVAEDLYCLMRDSDESMDENMDDIDNDNDNIIIKKFAIVNLPCKYELNCGKKIQLKNMKCKRNSVMDYYLISNGDYFKSEELIKLLDGNQINESQLLAFVNDKNHINIISKNLSKIQSDQKNIKQSLDLNVMKLLYKNTKFEFLTAVTLIIIPVFVVNCVIIILYVKLCSKKLIIIVPTK
ncbi:unnamed protein product [Didymodactylos carnosus]|uniref:Uncharacterized protein n=1 Tax=Didymodactylos carnosus TaxID=1234261 RepID=A0A816CKY2_9BILA|nr:unnamed protein product [Didymodactylos carnosus]CAF4513974.1 unnamed protein product [Didymodactylos carnosus]